MKKRLLLCLSILLLLACQRLPAPTPQPTATFLPEPTAVPPTSTATATATAVPTATATPIPPTPTPPPTATLAPLVMWLDDTGVDLQNHPANGPLIFRFSEPMEVDEDGKAPLRVQPSRSGEFSWDETRTQLTFTPIDWFEAAVTYTIRPGRDLRSQTGQPADMELAWLVRSPGSTSVVASPSVGIPLTGLRPTISLTFGREMNHATVAEALSLTPTLPYTLQWDGLRVDIVLEAALSAGQSYTIRLDDTVRTIRGDIVAPQTWVYELAEPELTAVPPTAENRTAPFALRFNFLPQETADPSALQFEPEVQGEWTMGSGEWLFTPEGGFFPSGQVYTLTLTADVPIDDGFVYPAGTLATFGPLSPVASISYGSINEDGDSEIYVRFDQPMEPNSTLAALQFTPAISATYQWDDAQTLYLLLPTKLAQSTTYQVKLEPTAEFATTGLATQHTFLHPLTTPRYASSGVSVHFGWGSNIQLLQADGRRAVQFSLYVAGHTNDLSATLHPLTSDQLPARMAMAQSYGSNIRRFRTSELEVAYSWPLTDVVSFHTNSPAHEFTIPAEVPPGIYVLSLRQDGVLNDQLLLVITHNTVVAKRARNNVLVWVTAIGGEAKPNLPVQIYSADGSLLASGTTDNDGRAQLTLPPNSTPTAVLAQDGDDYTVVGITGGWSYWDDGGAGGQRSQAFTANIYTDRPIYQPGHTVYYKAILRHDEDAILSNVGAGVTATLTVRDPRSNIIHTATITSNEFGTFNGEFVVAEGGTLGSYYVSIIVPTGDGRTFTRSQQFKVEDYRKPDYTVSVTLDRPYYLPGDPVTATVASQYFFGQPVSQANVEATFFQTYVYYYNQQPTPPPLADQETELDGTTQFSFVAPAWESGDRYAYWGGRIPSASYLLQATVDDGSGQAVTGFVPVRIYQNSEGPLVITNYWQRPNTPFNVGILVQGIEGNPIAGRQVSFELLVYQNNSFSGLLDQTKTLTTAEDGRVNHTLSLPEGYYQLKLNGADADGRTWQTERTFYVSPDNYPWTVRPSSSQFSIELDQAEYAPGDVAQLAIHSQHSGPALLTWQRGTLRGSELIELTAPLTVVPVLVTAEDAPNVVLNVTSWLTPSITIPEYVNNSLPDLRLTSRSINLVVPPNDKLLNVAILPQGSQFAPRQEITVAVQVTNFKGEPVSAELSLGMVDEAIYSLSNDLSQPLYNSFYFLRASEVSNYHSFIPTRYIGEGGKGGGGGGGEEGYGQEPRAEFPDTAAWFPALYTDANGLVTVTLTLPDSLTSWRLTARAVTADTQIGETTTNITVTQPVLVRPILPRTLTAGDDVLISVMAQNYLTTGVNLELELLSSDPKLLTITDETTQTVALFPDQRRTLGWTLSAEAAGEVQLTVIARQNGVVYDAIQLPLTIQPLAVRDVQAQVGQLTAGTRTLTFDLPATTLPISTINLELSRSIAGTMLEGLEYLTGFPYGCVEQTMSRALPNAVVGRAFNQLGYNTDLLAGLNEPINVGIQKLYGFQHDDGGWGWWLDDDTDGYQTAWVVFGLLTTAEAGHFVDPVVIKRGADWLLDNSASMDVNTRAFALYALARAAQYEGVTLDEESAAFILDQITVLRDLNNAQLNTFSQTALALALWEMGEETAAQDLLDEILATAETNTQTGAIHWSGANHDGYYHDKTMASDTRTTAFVVTAMSQMRPTADELPGAVRYLLGRRQAQGWGTTNETAFAILALTDYLLAQRTTQGDAPFNYTVQVNGQTVAQGSLTPTAESITIPLPLDLLDVGANEITLSHDGVGPLYYALRNEWYLAQTSIEAAGSLTVKRTYWDAEGQPFDIANAEIGQLVLVRLEVTNPEDLSYVIIEDKLPGGLEALNSRLNSQPRGLSSYEGMTYYWREYGYNYKEVFADRVSFFVTTLSNGRHVYEYTARVTHTGQFTALPAEAYAMYDLEQWGRSASDLWGSE